MPLSLLLPIVVLGIGGIAVLLHLTGHSRELVLADETAVRAAWARLAPDRALGTVLCHDNHALISTDEGVALMRVIGADAAVHPVRGIRETPTGLTLSFHDLGAPDISVTADQDVRRDWMQLWRRTTHA